MHELFAERIIVSHKKHASTELFFTVSLDSLGREGREHVEWNTPQFLFEARKGPRTEGT